MPVAGTSSRGPADRTLLDRLRSARVGVVLFSHRALPTGVPVCYDVDGADIVFRVAAGTPLARATDEGVVGLYAHELNEVGQCRWHATAAGLARHMTGRESRRHARLAIPSWWGAGATVYVRLAPDVVSGEIVGP